MLPRYVSLFSEPERRAKISATVRDRPAYSQYWVKLHMGCDLEYAADYYRGMMAYLGKGQGDEPEYVIQDRTGMYLGPFSL